MLDHHAVAGYLFSGSALVNFFGSDGTIPRREAHYRNLYQHYFTEGRVLLSPGQSRRLHDMLLSPSDA